MSDQNTADNIHVTDEPADASVTPDNIHVTDEPLAATAKDGGTVTPDNIHVTDEKA
ncbi:hypothetical protein ACIRVK_28485 [Streptomyces sp. NPDC101152]|uniref:hypothetical protein n=1 Tax=Streptomyces sp. NPDC101152 TaxID=3366116 RepID=UPI003823F5FE